MDRGAWQGGQQDRKESDTTKVTEHARMHAPNKGTPQCVRQILTTIKGEIDSNTINSGGLDYPTVTNEQIIQTKNE